MSNVFTVQIDPETGKPMRQVRSFVRREGRLTRGQERALEDMWPRFGVDYKPDEISLPALFGRDAPVVLEIGYGMGASLVAMAQAEPEKNFLGVEVHAPGVGALLMSIEETQVTNIRTLRHDAVEVTGNMLPDASLDRIQVYFPDPWHKTRHHKRRIVQPEFVALLARKLKPGGVLHLATDWENYAQWMLDVVGREPLLANLSVTGDYVERPAWRPVTKFERRGARLGHGVWDLLYRRV